MGDMSVILEGVESSASRAALYSTIHGAGRVMSRTQAAGRRAAAHREDSETGRGRLGGGAAIRARARSRASRRRPRRGAAGVSAARLCVERARRHRARAPPPSAARRRDGWHERIRPLQGLTLAAGRAAEVCMSRFSCAVLGCIVASTLALGAQQPQSVPPTPSAGAPGSTITVTGCIENAVADGSIGGTPLGTSATPANCRRRCQRPAAGRRISLDGRAPGQRVAGGHVGRGCRHAGPPTRELEGRAEDLRARGRPERARRRTRDTASRSPERWHRPCRAAPTLPPVANFRPACSACACRRSR